MDDIDWEQVFSWAAEMREQPPRPEVREKIRKHEHYVKNREKVLQRQRERYREHRDEIRAQQKAYRKSLTAEKKRAMRSEWPSYGREVRDMQNQRLRERYRADPEWRERKLASQRERRRNMSPEERERVNARQREYQRNHPEQRRETVRRYYERHPEQAELKRERAREKRRWMRENDPEAYRAWLDHRNMLARERRNAKKAAQTAGKEST